MTPTLRALTLHRFMRHDKARLEFPERGIVLVTGPNGRGKSSFIEAESWLRYGETLRGTAPQRRTGVCAVEADYGAFTLRRERSGGGRLTLTLTDSGAEPTVYTTVKSAQEALDARFPASGVWRRTSVFSAADAAAFTGGTDGERKRLLEALLGLDRYDTAHKRCLAEVNEAKAAVARAEGGMRAVDSALQSTRTTLDRIRAFTDASPGGLDPEAAEEALRMAQESARRAGAALAQAQTEAARIRAATGESERRLRALDAGTCPLCDQSVPAALLATLRGGLDALAAELPDVDSLRHSADREAEAVRAAAQAVERAKAEARAAPAAQAALQSLRDLEAQAQKTRADLASALDRAEVLGVVNQVLGLRGVRAHLLARTLGAVERAANVHLGTLWPGFTLRVGVVGDGVKVGAADRDGDDYRAWSSGERRRVDLALLFALADLAGGLGGGLLWFDEVLDALDAPEGVDVAAALLERRAEAQCLVVVTHRAELAERLRVVEHLRL